MLKLKIVQKYNKVLKFILITTSNKQKTRQNMQMNCKVEIVMYFYIYLNKICKFTPKFTNMNEIKNYIKENEKRFWKNYSD